VQTAAAAYTWGKIAAEVKANTQSIKGLHKELQELRKEVHDYATRFTRNSANLDARLDALERGGTGGE